MQRLKFTGNTQINFWAQDALWFQDNNAWDRQLFKIQMKTERLCPASQNDSPDMDRACCPLRINVNVTACSVKAFIIITISFAQK